MSPSTNFSIACGLIARGEIIRIQIKTHRPILSRWESWRHPRPGAKPPFFVHSSPFLHSAHRNIPLAVSLSKRVQKVKPSPTLAMTARAAKLKAEGKDIIGLAAGEPDFDTPLHIADAGVEAIRTGLTRYTAVDGTAELKDAIIAKFKRENGLTYERSQILVSSGAKQTCFNVCLALLDPGDECIIPAPYWVSYPDMAMLADGVPVIVYGGADARLQDHAGATGRGHHAAHQAAHPQQPEQSHRRRLHRCRTQGAGRGARAASASGDRCG